MDRIAELRNAFVKTYGQEAAGVVRAPGRVNLIGEHTDYNHGFCLPMAIERDVLIAWRARADATVRAASQEQAAGVEFVLSASIAKATQTAQRWADYLKGCAQILIQAGHRINGVDVLLTGNVPLGSGLSSSAALEVATIHALCAANGLELTPTVIATLAQKAENTYVGVPCGILDQLSSSNATAGHAMLMDCRTLALTPAPLPPGIRVVIADTGKRRGLVDSAYAERRAQCEAGARALGVSHLRDAHLHSLWEASMSGKLEAVARRRCEHVVAEDGRTLAAFACLKAGDAVALGELMDQSHADLRDKFEVTCPELDTMVAIARGLPACLGSRMTGAGFGGCTVSLVRADHAAVFAKKLAERYHAVFPQHTPSVYVTDAAAGAGRL